MSTEQPKSGPETAEKKDADKNDEKQRLQRKIADREKKKKFKR